MERPEPLVQAVPLADAAREVTVDDGAVDDFLELAICLSFSSSSTDRGYTYISMAVCLDRRTCCRGGVRGILPGAECQYDGVFHVGSDGSCKQ